MPRVLRSTLPDGFFHVTTRGVFGALVFRDDADRYAFMRFLEECIERYGWRVYAVCLMGTHYHLVVEATQKQLSRGMQYLNGRYAQTFNLRHRRHGHLWGGRFASWVIDSDEHFGAALEYIRQNPVAAGLVETAEAYAWTTIPGLPEHTFERYNRSPNGCRRAHRPRRPRAQPEGHHRPPAAEPPHLHHGPVRLGQVQSRLRHHLRRGPAPLRRVPLRLRAPVPADDGEAGRRLDRRPLAGDLDRPEDDLAQPTLDGRHGDRDLRLPAPAVRARRPAALPDLR